MNKALYYFLGLSLLSAEIFGMDTATFNSLIELYSNDELTRQQLLDAYDQLGSEEAQQEARTLLEELGMPLDELKAAALEEHFLFTMTFDTLIRMYKEQEITRAQLIKGYNLFETEMDKLLGDQALQVLLNKSIEVLRQEEASHAPQYGNGQPRRAQPAQPRRPAHQRGNRPGRITRRQAPRQHQRDTVAPRAQAPARQAAIRGRRNVRRQDPVSDHLSENRARNMRKNRHSQEIQELAQAQYESNRIVRANVQEEHDLQEAMRRSLGDQNRPSSAPIGNSFVPRNQPAPEHDRERQEYIDRLLDQNVVLQAQLKEEARSEEARPQNIPARPLFLDLQEEDSPRPVIAPNVSQVDTQVSWKENYMRQAFERAEEIKSGEREAALRKSTPQNRAQKKVSQERQAQVTKPAARNSEFARKAQLHEEEALKESRAKCEEQEARIIADLQRSQGGQQAATQNATETYSIINNNNLTTTAPKKQVRFNSAQKASEEILQVPARESRLSVATEPQAPIKEETSMAAVAAKSVLSVHLGVSTGTPVFQQGTTMLNPQKPDTFNQALAAADNDVITQWGHKLSQLASTDAARMKILNPIFEAFNNKHARPEKLELLVKETFKQLAEEKQQELTNRVTVL